MSELQEQAHRHFQNRQYELCIPLLEELHQQEPKNAAHASNLSFAFRLTGDMQSAIRWGELAIETDPNFAIGYLNLGSAYQYTQQPERALTLFTRGINLAPDNASLWTGLGTINFFIGKVTESIRCHQQALRLNPTLPEAYCNMAMALLSALDSDSAVSYIKQALEITPTHQVAASNLAMVQQYLPDLSLRDVIDANRRIAANFSLKEFEADGGTQARAGIARIGFVSGDFYQHPVGRYLDALFSQPREDGLEFYCYDNSRQEDKQTRELKANAEHWSSIHRLNDAQVAKLIRRHNVDLLIDLSGHTTDSRLAVFSYRPARVQASWLGFFASTGLPGMDYVLLGEDQVTPGIAEFYTEKIETLPCCQFNITSLPDVAIVHALPSDRRHILTFGCFNNPAKINHEVRRVWATILRDVPNSRLVLKWKSLSDPELAMSVRKLFAALGVDANRLILRGSSPYEDLLDEYNDIDVALDTFPFSGAMTTSESLWMGVPVVTLSTSRPVSRQSHAILSSLGLDMLITTSPKAYREAAISLAQNSELRRELRTTIRARLAAAGGEHGARLLQAIRAFAQRCAGGEPKT